GCEVLDPKSRLRLRVGGADGALADAQLRPAPALELDGIGSVVNDLQADLVDVEVFGRLEVCGQENNVDRKVAQHSLLLPTGAAVEVALRLGPRLLCNQTAGNTRAQVDALEGNSP